MKNCPWIDALHNEQHIALPIVVELDNQYLSTLIKTFNTIVCALKDADAPKYILDVSNNYIDQIIQSVNSYYKGNITEAHEIIKQLINGCYNDSYYAISNINNSIAFPAVPDDQKNEVQLFRARLNDAIVDFPANQMLHIPFKNRSVVKSERFSIPGLPCLYLCNSSYGCWIEMGCPAEHRFNVSPVLLDNSQTIFNLTVSTQNMYNVIDIDLSEKEQEKRLSEIMKLYLLNVSTSFTIKECDRNFKSEYIVSQMIMLACKNLGLNGVSYFSKRVSNEIFAHAVGVNIALFADYNGEESVSEICSHIDLGDSFNYSMFKQLCASLTYKEYRLRIDYYFYANAIGSFNRQFPYKETEFYFFDKYLFANWNRSTVCIDL